MAHGSVLYVVHNVLTEIPARVVNNIGGNYDNKNYCDGLTRHR